MKAFVDSDGVLTAWGYMEANNDDAEIEVPDDFAGVIGAMQYKDGTWSDYAAPVDHTADNTAQRDSLMATANAATYGMSDAYVAGLLDDADTATFKAWAKYKLALSKVDLTQASPAWPAEPSASEQP